MGIFTEDKEPPRRRVRAALEGLTFNSTDEIIAALSNPASAVGRVFGTGDQGAAFEKTRTEEAAKMKQYQQDYPGEALAYEIGGAMAPFVAATLFTGGTGSPATAPAATARAAGITARFPQWVRTGARMSAVGGLQGTVAGFMGGDGGFSERAPRAVREGATAALLAPALGAATYPVLTGAADLVDWTARKLGGRAGKAVEAELQRLVEQTGLTADEVVARVAAGELMAENRTLQIAVRGYMAKGGAPEAMVRDVIGMRPKQTREEAMAEIRSYLGDTADDNTYRVFRTDQKAAREAESEAYSRVFTDAATGQPVPAGRETVIALAEVFKRQPGLASDLARYIKADTGLDPFFTIGADGGVRFARMPSLQEAEVARRYLAGKTDQLYRSSDPMAVPTEALSRGMRGALDLESDALRAARAEAAQIRSEADGFKFGRKLLTMDPQEAEVLMDEMRNSPAFERWTKAVQAGLFSRMQADMTTARGPSLIGALNNPERREAQNFERVLPADGADTVRQKIGVAAQAQEAKNTIIGGSTTALTQAAVKAQGGGVTVSDLASVATGSPIAAMQIGMKLLARAAPSLNDGQRMQLIRILLSRDPEVVRRAITDEGGMRAFAAAARTLADRLRNGLIGGGVALGGDGRAGEAARRFGVQ